MLSRRYTIVIADRSTGVVRRLTLSLRPTLAGCLFVLALPVLMGLGARWSAITEIQQLRDETSALEMENTSFRAATGELTTQIASLDAVITELGERSALDVETKTAIENLPAIVKARAMGGGAVASTQALVAAAVATHEDTFGVLRDLLGSLESRLQLVRTDVERREALAGATPSIWPVPGWLSSRYGSRSDPFHGNRQFHMGLDISTDRGKAVFATADGVVQSARRTGDYGNLVVIDHKFGLTTRYAHLSRFAVKPGDGVKRGEVVGYVGATGRATGSHLHYEVWVNGKSINPLQLLVSRPGP